MSTRVLVIEDNQANLDLITYLLQAFGYAVSVAREGRSGLEAARREQPDLILCDVQMPVMDGFEVVEHLKRDPALRSIRTIAMTAYAMVGDRERLLAAGFDGYLSKPIQAETFIGQLEALAPRSDSARAAGAARAAAIATASDNAPVAPRAAETEATRGAVLVVDDTGTNVELVNQLLGHRGFEVLAARDTAEGLRLALERRPRLILCDVHIGEESGYDFVSGARDLAALKDTPFVFL